MVDDRFIWTFGGFDGVKVVDVIEMCDIKTGEWKTLNVKTPPRAYSSAVVVNDKIWIIGGWSSTEATIVVKGVEIFDTKTMTCTTAPSMIIPCR